VRIAVEHGFLVNVDLMFGLPGEDEGGQRASLAPAADLDDLSAGSTRTRSCHCPARHWRKQAEHSARLAEKARAYPPLPAPAHPARVIRQQARRFYRLDHIPRSLPTVTTTSLTDTFVGFWNTTHSVTDCPVTIWYGPL